jgi:xylulokinase
MPPEAASPLLLGVDVGTTAVKAAVFELDGRALASASLDYPIARPRPGWAQQDAEDWWGALLTVLERLGREADLRAVRSVGVCSQVNTHVPVDADGRALAPAIVWQDQRCAEIAASLDASLSDERRTELWDGPFKVDASFSLARAAWLAEHEPDVWERTAWLMLPKDYVNLRLTGQAATDLMSPVGLVADDGRYRAGVLALVAGAAERQPPLRGFADALGVVTAPELPALAGATVAVGTMDAWGSIFGSGLVDHGVAMDVAGTSEIVGVASRHARPHPGVISFPPLDGIVVHAGPTQAGGDALRWWAATEGCEIGDVLAAAAEAPPGAGGLLFHPYLAGERAPLWDSQARASFFGIGSEHDRRHFARAVLEGVAFAARHLLETAETAAQVRVEVVNASGGGNRSDPWCQIKADVLGRRLDRLRVCDTGVLGAALMGAVAAGLFDDLRTAARRTVEPERAFEPGADSARYEPLYRIYRDLYEASRPTYAALAAWRQANAHPSA